MQCWTLINPSSLWKVYVHRRVRTADFLQGHPRPPRSLRSSTCYSDTRSFTWIPWNFSIRIERRTGGKTREIKLYDLRERRSLTEHTRLWRHNYVNINIAIGTNPFPFTLVQVFYIWIYELRNIPVPLVRRQSRIGFFFSFSFTLCYDEKCILFFRGHLFSFG